MALSTAISIASFSVVLAEAFAAVGLSTAVPAGVVTLARTAKQVAAGGSPPSSDVNPDTIADGFKSGPAKEFAPLIRAIAPALRDLDLLLPQKAKIHAEFEFEANEGLAMSVGGSLSYMSMVSVSAGYSALYETRSKNKITLDVDFVSVNVTL